MCDFKVQIAGGDCDIYYESLFMQNFLSFLVPEIGGGENKLAGWMEKILL